jgi:hypothetical protein
VFTFPKSVKKQLVVKNENIPNTNDNLSEEKSKMIVSHFETVIVKLREELSQHRQLLQKYRHFGGRHCFCLVHLSVTQFVRAIPLKLLNRIS